MISLISISLNSLSTLNNLTQLNVAGTNVSSSKTLEFIRGKNLTKIDISNNDLDATELKKIFCYLEPKVLRSIDAHGSRIGYIKEDFFSCLSKAKLSNLILRHCNITGVSRLALRFFHGFLTLNLASNRIPTNDLSFVSAAKHVQSLNLDFNGVSKFPDFKVNGSCINIKGLTDLHLGGNYISTIAEEDTQCLHKITSLSLKQNKIVTLNKRALRNMTNLQTLSIGKNKMQRLGKDSLPTSLEQLDLTENDFNYYGLVPLGQLNDLYKLTISATDGLWSDLFRNKTKLTSLDISNGVISIKSMKTILKYVKALVRLGLTNVNLREIPVEILDLEHLRSLDLKSNKIQTIPERFVRKFNKLKTFNIGYNYLACNCSLLPFANWLRNASRRVKVSLDGTKCYSPAFYKGIPLLNFEKDCRNLLPIILPSVLVPVALLFILVTVISVKYRGYIRYGSMLLNAKWRGYGALEGKSFKYDTFVSYNREDEAWVLRVLRPKLENEAGYQICLHERDFTPGEDIVDNIITSIDVSRKTILVLSDDFAQSEWCQLEMSLAQHKLFEDNRDVLILIRLRDVAEEHMTKTMRMLMRTKTYITWPDGDEGLDLFWKNLIFALRRPPGVVMEDPEWPVQNVEAQNAENA